MYAGPTAPDVQVAIVSASAGLAGLVLVFGGIIVGARQALGGEVSSKVRRPYQVAGVWVLIALTMSLASVAVSGTWLVAGKVDWLYSLGLALFFLSLLNVLGIATYVVVKLVLQ
jgi:hypothetical protein